MSKITDEIYVVKQTKPPLLMPKFTVDGMLHKKLEKYEITKLMNKSNFTAFIAKPMSGKTSMITALLKTPQLFKKVFHKIILFMPQNSRQSIKGGFFDKQLPPEQIHDRLDLSSLMEVYKQMREDAEDNKKTLIIFDDVQKNFKGDCEKLLLEISSNRRHLKCSIWLVAQNYFTIPKQVRMNFTNLFVWRLAKAQMRSIFEEQIDLFKDCWEDILAKTYSNIHDFLFIDQNTQRLFFNWDEIIVNENSDSESDNDSESEIG